MSHAGRVQQFRRRLLQAAVASCLATAAHANPVGPSVVSGAATFSAVGKNLTVTNSAGTILNWQSFSIRPDEVTRFIQSGAASAVLNRVTGPEQSAILGQLASNGRVFLINPNGVTIGAGARVDTAGFVASSLNLSNEDFLAGKFRFTDPGNAGGVVNAGTINTSFGGPVYLIAPTVENNGVIVAPNGEVVLAAGKSVELVPAANPDLRVQVQAGGEALNVGRIMAETGRVGIYGAAIRNAGLISADSAEATHAGTIVLKATRDVTLDSTSRLAVNGTAGGAITVEAQTGTLLNAGDIQARGAAGPGGEVKLLGAQVGLTGSASVDASGRTGGGTVLVGGDYLGRNPDVPNARRTVLAPEARIAADATDRGDGGRVIVWSDEYTGFYGAVSARGGPAGGNGGFVETSSKDNVQAFGTVDAAAPAGKAGEWLLDPSNVTISTAATANGAFNGASPNIFSTTADDAVANVATIVASLNAGTSVTINTTPGGTQPGDIVVQDAITKTTATGSPTLALNAAGSIAVNNAVQGSAGGRVLNVALNAGGGIAFGATGSITSRNGTVTMNAGGAVALGNVNTGTGALSITANGAVTQNAGTALTVGGATAVAAGAANNVTLGNATNNLANVRIVSGNDVLVRDNTAFSFGGGASSVSGNLTVDSNGNVTQAAGATVTVGGATTINTRGANRDVTLTQANDFGGAVSVVPATNNTRNVTLQDASAITLGTITATGNLAVQANGAISDAGTLTVTGTTTLTAGAANDITLDTATNSFGNVRIVSGNDVLVRDNTAFSFGGGASSVSGNLTVDSNGNVTQAAGATLTVGGTTTINTRGANRDVTLTQANDFGGAVTIAPVGGGTIRDVSYRNVNASAITPTTPAAHRNLAITHDNAPVALPAKTLSGTLTVTAGGPITDTGALAVTGTTTLAAGANDITLDTATNSFGNVRIVSGNDVLVRDNTAFSFGGGASSVSGNLTVDSNGNVTQAAGATLTVGGTTTINTRGANRDVTLTQANDFGGAVTIAPVGGGTIRDVSYRNVNASAITPTTPAAHRNLAITHDNAPVALPAKTLSGTLTVTAGGPITDTGALAVTGTTTLAAGANDITLDTATNSFGNVRIVSGNDVLVRDNTAFSFGGGASSMSGNLTVDSNGNVTQAAGATLTVGGTTTINTRGANRDVTLTQANDFGGVVSIAAATGNVRNVNLVDANSLALGAATVRTLQARALGGDLTVNGPLTAAAAGSSIVLDASGSFVNNAGAAALNPGPGRWVVYSAGPAGDTFGGLASGNQAIWNATFAGSPPATIPAGNRYVFGQQPMVTFTSTDAAKTYGDDATAAIAGNFTTAGFVDAAAFGNVFAQDAAANAFAGAPSVTSAGAPAPASAGVYPIDIAAGTLAPTTGYAMAFDPAGQLTVGQRPITVTADNQSKIYGSPDPALAFSVGGSGLAGGDTIGSVFGGALTRAAGETVLGGPYAITQGTLAPNPNYTITAFGNGQLAITPKAINVTANDQSKSYGDPDPAFTYVAAGLVAGDTLGGALTRVPGEAVSGSPYAITQGTLTGASNPNYTIAFTNGQLAITPAALTIAADDKTRYFGQPNPPFTATITGFKFGETVAALTGALGFATPATPASPLGTYPITPGGVTSTNYAITFADGLLTVSAVPPSPPAAGARVPVDDALITATERSGRAPSEEAWPTAPVAPRGTDCLMREAPSGPRVLERCF
jgi:filamentous hemagglutinin family protein